MSNSARGAQPTLGQSPTSTTSLPPAGFESLYMSERSKLTSCFEAFVLPLHWAIIRGGLRIRLTDANPSTNVVPISELTEGIPLNWTSLITTKVEEETEQQLKQIVLRYWDHSNSEVHYEAKVMEVVKNSSVVVILFRAVNAYGMDGNVQVFNKKDIDSNSPTRNSAGTSFQLQDYVIYNESNGDLNSSAAAAIGDKLWFQVYKNLPTVENFVWGQLMEPIGLKVTGKTREPGPFENKLPQKTTQQQQQQPPSYSPMTYPAPPSHPYPAGGIGGPLYVPPAIPAGGGLGRSDLDPIGGFGAGMIADPRGFRTPMIPGGTGLIQPVPPGARFDPYGPPNPVPGAVQPRPQPGAGRTWGEPNPDVEQPPPGFDDMFM
ncbi:unnamed protein product [Orchesella dallaii]|uniref:Proteasome inhibitor PI31 subunit n=1 Tax=Orchesella dallaii TaxID=48710 RepID=A0ABP1S091_9HEXA